VVAASAVAVVALAASFVLQPEHEGRGCALLRSAKDRTTPAWLWAVLLMAVTVGWALVVFVRQVALYRNARTTRLMWLATPLLVASWSWFVVAALVLPNLGECVA
jgi:hypothetical protein